MLIETVNLYDVYVWPDGSWCYRHELPEMNHKSDDTYRLKAETAEWTKFLESEEPNE